VRSAQAGPRGEVGLLAGVQVGPEQAKTKKGEGEMSFPFLSFFFYFKAYFKTTLNAV
jgi:hypothetical protein